MANSSTTKSRDPLLILCGLVLITACLYWARQVLVPIALAVLLAFILTPAVAALQRRGLGRLPSVLLVVVLALTLLGEAGYLVGKQLNSLINNLPTYQDELTRKFESLRHLGQGGPIKQFQDMLENFSAPGGQEKRSSKTDSDHDQGKSETKKEEEKPTEPGTTPANPLFVQMASSGWSHVAEAAGPTAEGLANAFLIVVLVVFMLAQRENLRNRFVRLIGRGRLIATTQVIDEGAHRVSRFLLMQLFVNTLFAVALAIGLFVLGWATGNHVLWHYTLFWGFMALILRFIPYLGTWVAAALLTGFSIAVLPGWWLPLGVFGFFLALELLTANVVEPLLFGHSTGVSPLALLLAAAFWTWLWGPVGLVLSTPLTVILAVLGKYVPELRFFEVLLGDERVLSIDVTFYQRLVARDVDEASDLVEDYVGKHLPEAVYEEVLLPTLLHAKLDHERDQLETETYERVLQNLRDVEDDLAQLLAERFQEAPAASKALALGCPGCDEADELALKMLGQMMRLEGYTLQVVSAQKLTAEVLGHLERETPAAVVIGSLPPGGLSPVRYLCKRIRQQAPAIKILVGRWGDADKAERIEKRLRDAGADQLTTTLHDSRAQIIPLLQVAANTAPTDTAKPELVVSR